MKRMRSGLVYCGVLVALLVSQEPSYGGGGSSAAKRNFVVRIKNTSTGAIGGATSAPLVSIDTVEVGDANNDPIVVDGLPRGSVSGAYRMGTFEVTISQYTIFLNAVATRLDAANGAIVESLYDARMTSDANVAGISRNGQGTASAPYVYSTVGDSKKPIAYVTWFNAARFANWMHNGATKDADTENGAYTLNLATSGTITKNPAATWWIPSENEWFKAAYFKGGAAAAGYWKFPTQSDSFPANDSGSGTNQANFQRLGVYAVTQSAALDNAENYLTAVGTFINNPSAYGTFDQGGNVDEWTDTVISTGFGDSRITRGGAWSSGGLNNDVSPVSTALPSDRVNKLGFRLARAAINGGAASGLTGDFDVGIGVSSALLTRVNAGAVTQFAVRSGTFTVVAQDSVDPTRRVSKEFSTGNNRRTFITVTNASGQITISQASDGTSF